MRSPRIRYRTSVMTERFRLSSAHDRVQDAALLDYLASARLQVTEMSGTPLVAHLVHYKHISLALVSSSGVRVTWNRDQESRTPVLDHDRAGRDDRRLLPRSADLPGGNVLLVPPGSAPVEIWTAAEKTELIYLSVPASAVPIGSSPLRQSVRAEALPWPKLAPLYAFVHAFCTSAPSGEEETNHLEACTTAIVESIARAVLDDIAPQESLVLQVRAFIEGHHTDPTLSAPTIAAVFGVSVRTLQARFADEGSTVRDELRAARLHTALSLQHSHPRLSQLHRAQLAGFPSLSAMYRAFDSS